MSLNDPQWGKRGNSSGPPDLDEIWRNVNRRMSDLLGRRGGDDGGSGSGGPPRRGLALETAPACWSRWCSSCGSRPASTSSTKAAAASSRASASTRRPRPRVRAGTCPSPSEAVKLIDFSQVRTLEIGYRNTTANRNAKEATMLTEDENIIDIQFAVQYDLNSAEAFVFNNRKPEEMVKVLAESAIPRGGRQEQDGLRALEGREQIAQQTRDLMQRSMDRYKTGVFIQKVTLQSVQPPEKVQAAFDDAVKAQQDRVRLVNEGQAYANSVVPSARGMAARLLEEANGYNTEVTQRAEGDASRFRSVLSEYAKAPGVTRDRMYLDMMQTVLGNTSKVLVEQKAGNNLLYLPLDKLMQQAGAPAAAAAPDASGAPRASTAPAPAAPETPVTVDSSRSREGLRSRER
ncbi:MAG: FtsH protease activity modulator HflK [Burkholderiales bacterium]